MHRENGGFLLQYLHLPAWWMWYPILHMASSCSAASFIEVVGLSYIWTTDDWFCGLFSFRVASEVARPTFVQKPVIRQVSDKIVIECKMTSESTPTILWMCGERQLTDGGRFRIYHTIETSIHIIGLEISTVGIQDGGEYKVIVQNSVGESTATITLNFEGEFWIAPDFWICVASTPFDATGSCFKLITIGIVWCCNATLISLVKAVESYIFMSHIDYYFKIW